jgi:hypothetical protein
LSNLTQLAAFSRIKLQPDMVERLQASSKAAFGPFCPLRDCSHLSKFLSDEDDDAIGIGQGILAKDYRFGFVDRHGQSIYSAKGSRKQKQRQRSGCISFS